MKNILIALDYNPTAEKVAMAGYEVGKAMNANITLLHIIADPIYYPSYEYSAIMGFTGYWDAGIGEIVSVRKSMEDFLKSTKQHLGDDAISTLVAEGDFADTILDTADSINADMIVMGSHSQRWLENVLMGSVTKDVLRQTKKSLLIVPTNKSDKAI